MTMDVKLAKPLAEAVVALNHEYYTLFQKTPTLYAVSSAHR